jgi:hypothetical protein
MNARRLLALAAAIVAAFAGLYLGSPWLTAWDLLRAARARDVAALESHLDLPAVRASLKGQIDARLEQSIAKRAAKGDPVARFGALFGAALVDKTVDAAVTPEMIAEAVRTARAPDPRKSALAPPPLFPPDDESAPDDKPKAERVRVGFAMPGLNRFDIRLSPADAPDTRLTLILHRRGLFDWKLTDVQLPR